MGVSRWSRFLLQRRGPSVRKRSVAHPGSRSSGRHRADGVDGTRRRVPWVGNVLVRVDVPILDVFQEGVEERREERAEEGAEPVLEGYQS